jgi:ribose/xylose/arabinose/galactoside ABC-type transport system permease subunit
LNWKKIELSIIRNLIWVLDGVFFIVFLLIVPGAFGTLNNIHYILYFSGFLGFGVIAEAIVLINGNFDLSIGENIGFSAMLTAVIVTSLNWPPTLAGIVGIILIIAISTGLGCINGLLVGYLKLNAFLATLATYILFMWGTLTIRSTVVYGLPWLLLAPGSSKVGGVWVSIPIFFAFALLLFFIFQHTRLGSNLFAVGADKTSSKMLGLNVDRIVLYAYLLAGFFAGLSALMYVGFVGCVPPTLADGSIFDFFAGAILGGVSIRGGRGRGVEIIGGILFLGITRSGLIMLGIDPNMVGLLTGFFILIAIIIDAARNKLLEKLLLPE